MFNDKLRNLYQFILFPKIDPDDVPSDFRRGLEQSLEAVSSPEPENEATETNASTPDNVKDQSWWKTRQYLSTLAY